jgi:hypothetical protein
VAARAKIHARFPKDAGNPHVEVHVRTVTLDGIEVVDIRDYYPSLKTYGRGLGLPRETLNELINGLVILNSDT